MMKILLILIALAAAFGAKAQSTNAPVAAATQATQATQPSVQRPPAPAPRPVQRPTRPNQALLGKTLVSGVAVQAVKTRNPLQLLNPLAPAEYGQAQENVSWNPANNAPAGLKIFAVSF